MTFLSSRSLRQALRTALLLLLMLVVCCAVEYAVIQFYQAFLTQLLTWIKALLLLGSIIAASFAAGSLWDISENLGHPDVLQEPGNVRLYPLLAFPFGWGYPGSC